MLGELDGEAGNPACPAVNENRLAGLKFQRFFDRTQRGEPRESQRSGIDVREAVRFLPNNRRLARDLLAITPFLARLANAEHRTPNLEIGAPLADGADHAAKIAAEDQWKLRLLILAGAHFPIGGIDAGG